MSEIVHGVRMRRQRVHHELPSTIWSCRCLSLNETASTLNVERSSEPVATRNVALHMLANNFALDGGYCVALVC